MTMMIVLMMMAKLMMMINDHDHDHDDHDDVSCVSGVANKVTLPYLHPLTVKGNARGKPLYKENDFIHELTCIILITIVFVDGWFWVTQEEFV